MGKGPGIAQHGSKKSKASRRMAAASEPAKIAGRSEAQDKLQDKRIEQDQLLEEALIETFPASDPIAIRIEPTHLPPDKRPRRERSKD
jgi:hypothetical protein